MSGKSDCNGRRRINKNSLKKLSTAKKFRIIAQSLCVTLWYSLKTLFTVYAKKLQRKSPREAINYCLHDWAKKLLAVIKVNYKIYNPHQIKLEPNQPYIIMSNHASHYDIPLIAMAFPNNLRMLAKKELFKVPVWGAAMKAAEILSVDRNNARQAVKDLAFVRDKMESGIVPWIAPEGTRSHSGSLGEFKKGGFMVAQKTGARIIPVGISGSNKLLPPKTCDFQLGESVDIYIGEPIDASAYKKNEIKKLMQDTKDRIQALISNGD